MIQLAGCASQPAPGYVFSGPSYGIEPGGHVDFAAGSGEMSATYSTAYNSSNSLSFYGSSFRYQRGFGPSYRPWSPWYWTYYSPWFYPHYFSVWVSPWYEPYYWHRPYWNDPYRNDPYRYGTHQQSQPYVVAPLRSGTGAGYSQLRARHRGEIAGSRSGLVSPGSQGQRISIPASALPSTGTSLISPAGGNSVGNSHYRVLDSARPSPSSQSRIYNRQNRN